MPILVMCPACGGKTKAPDSALGKRTKCPKCDASLRIPDAVLAMLAEPLLAPTPLYIPAVPATPPLTAVDDIAMLDELDPTPSPSLSPPAGPMFARPVNVSPPTTAVIGPDLEQAGGEFNPFAGLVVPGSAAEAVGRDHAKPNRRRDDEDDDQLRRKRR